VVLSTLLLESNWRDVFSIGEPSMAGLPDQVTFAVVEVKPVVFVRFQCEPLFRIGMRKQSFKLFVIQSKEQQEDGHCFIQLSHASCGAYVGESGRLTSQALLESTQSVDSVTREFPYRVVSQNDSICVAQQTGEI
jgi:hypothetical protein